MSIKRYLLPTITILVILGLLYAAAWQHAHPRWHGMPESLTKPDPNIDRSHMPLGPYTADFSGLIGGPTGDKRVTFYVVMRPGDVHLQRVGEVGKKLAGASVTSVGIQYMEETVPPQVVQSGGPLVDGLVLLPDSVDTIPKFVVPHTRDSSGQPIKIHCLLYKKGRDLVAHHQSFRGIAQGMCTVIFRPAPHLHAWMGGVQPPMFPSMAQFLPKLYEAVVARIQGEP